MKRNYPAGPTTKFGATQQAYEAGSKMQREGVKRLLKAAGIEVESARTIVDLGCRNGDTTLGIAQVAHPDARIIGIDEYRQAVQLARFKFGILPATEFNEIAALIPEMPYGWAEEFRADAERHNTARVSFTTAQMDHAGFGHALDFQKVDLIVGFQLLHWLDCEQSNMPKLEAMKAIAGALKLGGTFISGTSIAFIETKPWDRVEGKTRVEYSIDEHPFVKMVYKHIADMVASVLGQAPQPISAKPPLSFGALRNLFISSGFSDIRIGAFLVTSGREQVISEVMRLRPVNQRRLNGIEDAELGKGIIELAIRMAHYDCDKIVRTGDADPRLDNGHIYDAVPFIKATKPLQQDEGSDRHVGAMKMAA